MGYLKDGVRHAAWFMRKCHTEPGLLWAQVVLVGEIILFLLCFR